MNARRAFYYFGISFVLFFAAAGGLQASEIITLNFPGGKVRGKVLKVTKKEVVLKTTSGKERTVPAIFLKPKDLLHCRKQLLGAKDAKGHFELGQYALKNGLKRDGREFLEMAAALDAAAYKEKVEGLLGKKEPKTPAPKPKLQAEKPAERKAESKTPTPREGNGEGREGGEGGDELVTVRGPGGRLFKIPKRLLANRANVPARTPEQMKQFLDKRKEELKKVVGGDWRMDETKHFYVFSNIPLPLHQLFKSYCEALYDRLCMVMDHKDGDPLWNNKCPLYFFSSHRQFEKFGVRIDHSPGATVSGGYFSHHGRECHVAIPVYSKRYNGFTKQAKRHAMDTLFHETTHAFLQLTGKNVNINSWLHEGMAQFIEFWMDGIVYKKFSRDKLRIVTILRQFIRQEDLLDFEGGRMRPMGGADVVGYAFAWSRVEFLYVFGLSKNDRRVIPKLIRAIKDGKTEEEAIKLATGMEISQFDTIWENWLKLAAKKNFRR